MRVAGAEDVEFLLNEVFGFVGDRFLCITYVHHAAGEGYFFYGHAVGCREAYCFYDYVRAVVVGEGSQFSSVDVFGVGIDGVMRAGLLGDFEFRVVDVDDDCVGTARRLRRIRRLGLLRRCQSRLLCRKL